MIQGTEVGLADIDDYIAGGLSRSLKPSAQSDVTGVHLRGIRSSEEIAVSQAAAYDRPAFLLQVLFQLGLIERAGQAAVKIKIIFIIAGTDDEAVVTVIDNGMYVIVACHHLGKVVVHIVDELDIVRGADLVQLHFL